MFSLLFRGYSSLSSLALSRETVHPPAPMAISGRNFGLDVMRATAILLVVFAHYFASTPLQGGGLLGVEIFFVLSGFLIGDILIRSLQHDGATPATLKTFWMKRWFRTLR